MAKAIAWQNFYSLFVIFFLCILWRFSYIYIYIYVEIQEIHTANEVANRSIISVSAIQKEELVSSIAL